MILDDNLLYINGEDIMTSYKDRCYISIFANENKYRMYVGNIMMAKYYIVFDMTPFSERGESFIQVGIAEQAPKMPLLQRDHRKYIMHDGK